MANTYGRQVVLALTNKSGGSVAAGDVVVIDTANNDAFTTTTSSGSTKIIGIAQETIANNAAGRVLTEGYAALVNVNASVTRGNYGTTHTVAKQATDGGASRTTGTFCQFLTGGTTPDAVVFKTDLSSGGGTGTVTTVKDEGTNLSTAVVSLDFVGAGVTATGTTAVTVTIPGGGTNFVQLYVPASDPTSTTGAWSITEYTDIPTAATTVYRGIGYQSSGTQNDQLSWDIFMDAGTYTCTIYGRKSSNTGIITLNLDTVSQGTIDTYAASPAALTGSITGISVSAGKRTWQVKAATKNASSSSYFLELFAFILRRTA